MKLFQIYESGAVRRFHAKRLLVHQTVADHSWGVCIVLMWLYYPDLPPNKMFQQALLHDCPELITGDIPAPAKWRSPELRIALGLLEQEVGQDMGLPHNPWDEPIQKFADNAELAMRSLSEIKMGNTYLKRTFGLAMTRMKEIKMPTESFEDKANFLIRELDEASQEFA